MIKKKILVSERVRNIDGGFSFIPHRFLYDGFLAALTQEELMLYMFLVLAGDRNGLSFYSYDRICGLLHLTVEQYIAARNGLVKKDLIAFDGTLFQVLSLPSRPFTVPTPKAIQQSNEPQTPVAMKDLINHTLKAMAND